MTDVPAYPAFPLTDREKALMEEIWRSAGERFPAITACSDLPIGKVPDPLEDLRAALADLEDLPPPPGHLIALVREEDYGRLLAPLLEVGIRRQDILISEHPDPGFCEVVEIPRPRLSFPW